MLPTMRTLILASLLALLPALSRPPACASDETSPEGRIFQSIGWGQGPRVVDFGGLAQISVPRGLLFTDPDGAKRFMEVIDTPTSGKALGVIMTTSDDQGWYAVFRFIRDGYIRDTDRERLDSDALLKSIRDDTAAANEGRKKRGLPSMEIVSWERPPSYDLRTKSLTWAVRGRTRGKDHVEYSSRILGREGYVAADFVLASDRPSTVIPAFENLMAGFHYSQGHRYDEFHLGDKIAAHGLAPIVAGSAMADPAKTGLLAKTWGLLVALFLGGILFLRTRIRAGDRQA